jgi:hypothetical protein
MNDVMVDRVGAINEVERNDDYLFYYIFRYCCYDIQNGTMKEK